MSLVAHAGTAPLTAAAEAALALARSATHPILATVPFSLPAAVLSACSGDRAALPALVDRAGVVWELPAEGLTILGLGEALRLQGPRGSSLADAARSVRCILRASRSAPLPPDARLRLFGGAAFDPANDLHDDRWDAFGGWQFVAPRITVAVRRDEVTASATFLVDSASTEHGLAAQLAASLALELEDEERLARPRPGSRERGSGGEGALAAFPDPATRAHGLAPAAWKDAVSAALVEIEVGRYQKVVLARQVRTLLPESASIAGALERLARRYAHCFVFRFAAGDGHWLGASPERLVSLGGGRVRAASLAGSRPRGATPEEDDALADELIASPKERAEHAYVVDAVAETLRPLCATIHAPEEPGLMRLSNIQHLHTPVHGDAAAGVDIFDLVAAMHPTPAVGGLPRSRALDAIRRLEHMDRGWYASPIGWVDAAGDGEFAVALRAALVSGGEAVIFAGSGIVAGSDPEQELAEVELKMRPLRDALAASTLHARLDEPLAARERKGA